MIEANETLKPYCRRLGDKRGNGSKRSAEGGSVDRWGGGGLSAPVAEAATVRGLSAPVAEAATVRGLSAPVAEAATVRGGTAPVAEAATVRGLSAPVAEAATVRFSGKELRWRFGFWRFLRWRSWA